MYTSFSIENFRLFDQLTVEPLARVNLIAGQNNAGKTALLEALWLHAGQNNPELARRINLWRGLPGSEPGELFSDLFREYQTNSPIKLSAKEDGDYGVRILTISRQPRKESATRIASGLFAEPQTKGSQPISLYDEEIVFEYTDPAGNQFPARAWIEITPLPFELPVAAGLQFDGNVAALRAESGGHSPDRRSSVFMQSLGRIGPPELAARFGRAEIGGYLHDVENVLQLVEPRLRRLTAVPSAEGPALIYGDIGTGRIIPVMLMGSGFARLLELTLAFIEVSNGSILIDEIENGLHYSVLVDVWKALNDLSKKFNVQVFATTHSYECIRAAVDAIDAVCGLDEFNYMRIQWSHKSQRFQSVHYDDLDALKYAFEHPMEIR